jgi:hypothetical protein
MGSEKEKNDKKSMLSQKEQEIDVKSNKSRDIRNPET